MAATDDPGVNAAVAAAAEERRIFCARADDARESSAWTMAAGHHGSVTVAVVGNREPRQSAALRDEIVTALRDGHLSTTGALDHAPGVVLVGGGPGDPELVTVAARHALASADVVVADRLAPRELLDELGPHVELVDVAKLPRGRSARAGGHQRADRRPGARREAGGALQGRGQLRLRSRLRGARGLRGGGGAGHRGARA